MSIKSRTEQNGRIAIIDVRGSLVGDGDTDVLRGDVNDFIEQGNKCLVINLQKVNYMNSTGIGSLISAFTSYKKAGGEVKLAGLSNNIQSLLAVTKLIDVFDVHDTIDQAVKSFQVRN
jgi:anti-sigma B factor antagonist